MADLDVRALVDGDEVARKMYADPALTRDLLAIGLAVNYLLRHGEARLRPQTLADMLGLDRRTVMWTLADDRPRYLIPDTTTFSGCQAPLTRKPGRCGAARWSVKGYAWVPNTGERYPVSACDRHRHWAAEVVRESEYDWRQAGAPRPPANAGGVLARYFDTDWPTVYRWGDPAWTPPPAEPERTLRPRFTVLPGDGDGDGGPSADLAAVR